VKISSSIVPRGLKVTSLLLLILGLLQTIHLLDRCTSFLGNTFSLDQVVDVVTLFRTQWRQYQIARYQLYYVKCSSIL